MSHTLTYGVVGSTTKLTLRGKHTFSGTIYTQAGTGNQISFTIPDSLMLLATVLEIQVSGGPSIGGHIFTDTDGSGVISGVGLIIANDGSVIQDDLSWVTSQTGGDPGGSRVVISYADVDITTGLILSLPCQDFDTTAVVKAKVGSNAALLGGSTTQAVSVPGPGGLLARAIGLNGTTASISGLISGLGNTVITLFARAKPTGTPASAYLIDVGDTAVDSRSLLYGFPVGFWNAFKNGYPVSANQALSRVAANAGAWQSIAYTADGTTVTGWRDGASVISGSGNLSRSTAPTQYKFGNDISADGPFGGAVCDLQMFNRALSALEIKTLHSSYLPSGRGRSGDGSMALGLGMRL